MSKSSSHPTDAPESASSTTGESCSLHKTQPDLAGANFMGRHESAFDSVSQRATPVSTALLNQTQGQPLSTSHTTNSNLQSTTTQDSSSLGVAQCSDDCGISYGSELSRSSSISDINAKNTNIAATNSSSQQDYVDVVSPCSPSSSSPPCSSMPAPYVSCSETRANSYSAPISGNGSTQAQQMTQLAESAVHGPTLVQAEEEEDPTVARQRRGGKLEVGQEDDDGAAVMNVPDQFAEVVCTTSNDRAPIAQGEEDEADECVDEYSVVARNPESVNLAPLSASAAGVVEECDVVVVERRKGLDGEEDVEEEEEEHEEFHRIKCSSIDRVERSNSCTQAEAAAAAAAVKTASSGSTDSGCIVGNHSISVGAVSSLSHDNLVHSTSEVSDSCYDNNNSSKINESFSSAASTKSEIVRPNVVTDKGVLTSSYQTKQSSQSTPHKQQQQSSSSTSSSSRFFSSKLNTGSLWSLLSVGGSTTTSTTTAAAGTPNEMSTQNDIGSTSDLSTTGAAGDCTSNDAKQKKEQHESLSTSLLNRMQSFKLSGPNLHTSRSPASSASNTDHDKRRLSSSADRESQRSREQSPSNNTGEHRRRHRFTIKYIGSALLHKNFTLPMLEWIARDIKRQTVKGAQSTSQRQFTIPARDIIFEIHPKQLTAISCKDGHCIFVHPMHCVSKYAQLQHDPTCFSYLIRDNKESPSFCHVFQARNVGKVHELFSAIREATTRTQLHSHLISDQPGNKESSMDSKRVIKSASADGQSTSMNKGFLDRQSIVKPNPLGSKQMPPPKQPLATALKHLVEKPPSQTFENTYQFEVMFVKKVKLQCRRVPATFVDDALETLKSFEVLKGNELKATQIKGGVGKRIINASVDERQEYDEACQSPTPSSSLTSQRGKADKHHVEVEQRRGSSITIGQLETDEGDGGRGSRSCQISPSKGCERSTNQSEVSSKDRSEDDIKKHQSMDCLESIDSTIKSAKSGDAPNYSNDFSPYNTITSNDLNERIAAMPVVSGSVSLDHETRQKLARQVRETIMATAANIKKGVFASGDKLDSSTSSKALDSLSCTATSEFPPVDTQKALQEDSFESTSFVESRSQTIDKRRQESELVSSFEDRRSSEISSTALQRGQHLSGTNNFDLFRRASARQVIKNRTMLLLIGKDELCTISIDKHQMLFSKTFSSIVHCLQGNNNKDHFGLICRDSGKINPNAESYAGFIFKCQSDKVVREIMSALKQVIYSSQHNYHGYNSPYNPINSVTGNQFMSHSTKGERFELSGSFGSDVGQLRQQQSGPTTTMSLAAKRGFVNPIDISETSKKLAIGSAGPNTADSVAGSPPGAFLTRGTSSDSQKNPIKSMFCDSCPLYWYHRLCIDIESLPADSSKTIILRRVDSSLTEQEQDEIYSKFSEFTIDSIDEHNEIFMSLLRHLCEKKQLKHNQSHSHLSSMAKSSSLAKQQSLQGSNYVHAVSRIDLGPKTATATSHQRSGSTSGSFTFAIGPASNSQQAGQSIADASSAAIDNLMRAKNTISVSIENLLRRRPSLKDEQDLNESNQLRIESSMSSGPMRSGSFKGHRESGSGTGSSKGSRDDIPSNLKRSQSTTDHQQAGQQASTWKDTLTKTINDEMTNPIVGLFRRRSSTFGSKTDETDGATAFASTAQEARSSAENLSYLSPSKRSGSGNSSGKKQNSPTNVPDTNSLLRSSQQESNLSGQQNTVSIFGGSSPSSVLSGVFWKKSIFDKIKQPIKVVNEDQTSQSKPVVSLNDCVNRRKKSPEELRSLWRKAILEQITLLKMDHQNQKLQATTNECNIQRMKLNYRDVVYLRDATKLWDKMLKQDPTKSVPFVEVAKLVRMGVPKQRRGEIWMFLMNQYQLRHGTSFQPADSDFHGDANQSYRNLLSQLSVQQHEIFVDIGKQLYFDIPVACSDSVAIRLGLLTYHWASPPSHLVIIL